MRGNEHFTFPITSNLGTSPTGVIAIPRYRGKAWNNFEELLSPSLKFRSYAHDPTPIVTIRCILKEGRGVNDLLAVMCPDGFLKCNASYITARPDAFQSIFVVSDPEGALIGANLPFVNDQTGFDSLITI